MEHHQPLHQQPKANNTVVVVQPEDRAEPPPPYQVANIYQEKTTFNTLATTLEEAEDRVAGLALSEVDVFNSSRIKSPTEVLIKPLPKLIEVQEKVRCLAIDKRERRDARRAEKAMKIEAWKERKQAKRIARAAWREERRAVRA